MNVPEFNNLDDFIEHALRAEPMRSVPLGFAREVEQRLQLAQLLRSERHRFARCFAVAGALAFTVTFALTALAILNGVVGSLAYQIPGILGTLDFVGALLAVYWTGILGVVIVGFACVTLTLLLLETRRRNNWATAS